MARKVNELSTIKKAQLYWEVCQAYNRQTGPKKGITTEKAIKLLRDIEQYTSPQKNLAKKTTKLLDEIICAEPEQGPTYFNNVSYVAAYAHETPSKALTDAPTWKEAETGGEAL